jgi:hypothetical protein
MTMATIDTRVSPQGKTTYRARARLKGYPQETASFSRKTDARKWAEGVEAAMREGRYFTTNDAKRHTLGELVERYERDILPLKPKNARHQRRQLVWWKAQLGDYRLSDVTPAKIVDCRDRLLNTPRPNGRLRSNSTAVRYLAVLSHAFSVAMKEWGWVTANPLRNVSKPIEPRGRVRSWTKMSAHAYSPRAEDRAPKRCIPSSYWHLRLGCAEAKSWGYAGGTSILTTRA